MAKLDRFDAHLPAPQWSNPWQADGSYRADFELLQRLLSVGVGSSQRSGVVAGAVDMWVAEELRRAGFDEDEVWPRRSEPRVLPRDLRNFVQSALTKPLREQVEQRYASPGARRALPAEAHVMGSAYSKQGDVVIASWAAGVELLVSTKTMLSSYQKNLRNRFEEGYGDAKNLRGRHPLASLGFVFVAGSDIPDVSLSFAIDMLRKLTTEPDVYDCACLIVVDGAQAVQEDELIQVRDVEDEPAALTSSRETLADDVAEPAEESPTEPSEHGVAVISDAVPPDLAPDTFFERLVVGALDRMPIAVYPEVRRRRAVASAPA